MQVERRKKLRCYEGKVTQLGEEGECVEMGVQHTMQVIFLVTLLI